MSDTRAPAFPRRIRVWLATRTLPWFVLSGVLAAGGVIVLSGTGEAAAVLAAVAALIVASIRYIVLAVRDDPLRSLVVSRRGFVGMMAADSKAGRRRRARRRAAAAEDGDREMHYEAPRSWR